MGHPLRPCDSKPECAWMRRACCIPAAIFFATAGGVVLAVFSEPFERSWLLGPRHYLLGNILPNEDAGVVGAVAAGTNGLGVSHARGMQDRQWKERRGNETLVSPTTAAALCRS